jgi:D-alanine-D-alanine ligase
MFGHCYTGSPPRSLILCRNKAVSKEILDYHGVRTPRFVTYPAGRRIRAPRTIGFPLIVKPVMEDASVGISQASIVSDEKALKERVEFVHKSLKQPAIAEELVRGRELYVGILGNSRPRVLPVVEMVFKKAAEGDELIATYKAKWDWDYRERKGIESVFAGDLDADTMKRLERMSLRAYRALYVRDYGRVDLRLTPEGELCVLEVNPNPYIRETEDLPKAAERAGFEYVDLLEFIIRQAMQRKRRKRP